MDPFSILHRIIILAPPILLAITIHEVAHGWVAFRMGDPTASRAGRLSLNPIKHLDPVGTLVFFVTQAIGWAKPVPVNPYNFRNPRQGMVWVSLAGPASNLLLAAALAIMLRGLAAAPSLLGLLPHWFLTPFLVMSLLAVQVNIGLAIFNLVPIPPLDGSKVVAGLLPESLLPTWLQVERYGFILLIVLVFTGVTGRIIVPLIIYLDRLLLGPMAGLIGA